VYAVFLSDGDPVLGDGQADFARRCGFPLRRAGVKGHVGLACRPQLFDELLDALEPAAPPRASAPGPSTPRQEQRPRRFHEGPG